MKKLLLLIYLLPLLAFGQEIEFSKDFSIQTSKPYKVIDAGVKHYYEVNNNIIAIKTNGNKVFIQKLDGNSLEEVSRKEFEDFPKKMEIKFTCQTETGIYYFFSVWDKKEKQEKFYVREIDIEEGTFEKQKLLFSTSQKVLPSTIKLIYNVLRENSSDYSFKSSFDGSKYLIQYRVKPEVLKEKNSYDLLGFQVFDNKFNKLWAKEIKMPYTEKEMNNISYTVNSKANVYMLAYINKSKTYELLEITENTTKITPMPLDLEGDLFFNQIMMIEKKDGNINCIGYYANGLEFKYSYFGGLNSSMNINGITQFTVSTEGEIVSSYKVEFPIDFINQYENDRIKNKNEKREADGKLGIRDLKLRKLVEYGDGSSLLIGEQFFSEYQYDPLSRSGKTLHHYYEDVVACKIDEDGNVLWMKKLPKEQERTPAQWNWRYDDRGGLSIKHVKNKDYHYILFMDNVKNIDISMDEKPVRHIDRKGGYLTAYKIDDKTGEVEKLSIFNSLDLNGLKVYNFRTSRLLLSDENDLFLEVYIKGKNDILIKINLNE